MGEMRNKWEIIEKIIEKWEKTEKFQRNNQETPGTGHRNYFIC